MKTTLCLAALAAAAGAFAEQPGRDAFTGEITLVLYGALVRGTGDQRSGHHLVLDLAAADGRWERAWGSSLSYNNFIAYGLVRKASVAGAGVQLDVELKMGDDRWTRGGRGAYAVNLKRGPEGALEGTFAGAFKGEKVSGQASGELRPPRPMRVKDYRPLRPGEHPRMLFRKTDLPALREKLETPFGRAYLDLARKSGDLLSLGMLYQLTGRRDHAEEALKMIRAFKGEVDPNPAGSGSTGHRLVEISFAYDLCCDAWPEDFRKELAEQLFERVRDRQKRLHPGHANYHPCSNYYGPGYGSVGLAGLAIRGEKGPAPVAPEIPFNVRTASWELAPAADYKPGQGAPVANFADGQMPQEWIYAGGFKPQAGQDILAGLGGAAAARPEAGTKLSLGDRTDAFRLLSHEPDKGYYNGTIDVTNAIGRIYYSSSCFYTVIDNDGPRWVQLSTDYDPADVYISGARLRHGALARLNQGLYPVMVVVPIGETAAWGRILVQPRLRELTEEQAQAAIADQQASYAFEKAMYEADREFWEKSGGVDPAKMLFADMSHWRNYWHIRLGIGDGGFQAETGVYAMIGSWYPLVYSTAFRKAFGVDVSPRPDITHLMPRRMMQVVFREDGKQLVQKINSVVGFDLRWCAASFPIVPDEYKPALLWAWNWATGVTDQASTPKAIQGSGLDMAHTFLHYPLDLKPAHPAKSMPLSWAAPDFGFYCFRSAWEGKDEFIGQTFLKAKPVNGWNHGNAGTFTLLGLGREWVSGSESRNGVRPQESVVWLPQDQLKDGGCAQLTWLKTEPDGSGSMTFDLSHVYSKATDKYGLYDRNLIRNPEPMPPSEVTGLRALAFDYSGKSGAPCLMVMVDRILGGKEKLWAWQMPDADPKAKTPTRPVFKSEANSFTLSYPNAFLKATFAAPDGVKIVHAAENIQVGDPRHGYHGPVDRVKATGADPGSGEFFVVITVQEKAAPQLEIQGRGLDAKVRAGKQTIRFDGRKIILGAAE